MWCDLENNVKSFLYKITCSICYCGLPSCNRCGVFNSSEELQTDSPIGRKRVKIMLRWKWLIADTFLRIDWCRCLVGERSTPAGTDRRAEEGQCETTADSLCWLTLNWAWIERWSEEGNALLAWNRYLKSFETLIWAPVFQKWNYSVQTIQAYEINLNDLVPIWESEAKELELQLILAPLPFQERTFPRVRAL